MKFAYKFSNLLGTVYRKGNLLFSPDGNSVISPVGNRITVYDLKNNKAETLPTESKFNYEALDLSPNGCILLAVNEDGEAHLISLISKTIIHKYRFNRPVKCIRFSPDGKYFAVTKENHVFVFRAPGPHTGEFNPFVMERIFRGAHDETVWIEWSTDSRMIAVASKDMTTRLYSVEKFSNFTMYSLGSHTDSLVACFFEKNSFDMITVSRNGHVCVWECSIEPDELEPLEPPVKKKKEEDSSDSEDDVRKKDDPHEGSGDEDEESEEEEKKKKLFYKRLARHYLSDLVKDNRVSLTAATYHKETHILVTGFSNGSFFLHEMPDVNLIHSLSISEYEVSSIVMNNTGDWIALGCIGLGQLLVWEWQSETYVMKQQGHFNNMSCLTYSPDGQYIATGGEDGKVKIWNTSTGFCFVTFKEHTSGITGIQFSSNRNFIICSSLDGTARAFDIIRYRNFRTFTSPRPAQFACIAMDSSNEFVAAGGQDVFEIYLWSMKVGRLLEVLGGHEGPVVSIAFNPNPASTAMASVSWDKTLRLWNAIESGNEHETIDLTSDGVCVVYRPDGEQVAVATLNGQISFFMVKEGMQCGSIEGRNDLGSGKADTDLISAKKNLQGKSFTTLCYSADGQCILAGGSSKNVCIYNANEALLVKKFEITQNRSFDAVDDFINRRKMTEFGNMALVEDRDDGEKATAIRLPGVRKGDMASRVFKPEVRVFSLRFSPTGQAWAAATTEGLLVYSLNHGMLFDPFLLEVDITPDSIRATLKEKDYAKALMMSMRLNEQRVIQEVLESIPPNCVELVTRNLPQVYVERLLKFVGAALESTRHIEFYLTWIQHLFTCHGPQLRSRSSQIMPVLQMLQKNMTRKYDELSKICDFNKYTISYVLKQADVKALDATKMEIDNDDEDDGYVDDEEGTLAQLMKEILYKE